jgi:selenide,water dikinase
MACASKVTIEITSSAVPLLDGALELATFNLLTSGDKTNREYIGSDIAIHPAVDSNLLKLLFDPQTAGGMLISVPHNRARALLARLKENYSKAAVIGHVLERGPSSIIVR